MSQGQGSISESDLMRKLVNAKKVMNKVDGGNYERGHVNEAMLRSDPSELMENQQPQQSSVTRSVSGPVNVDRIQNSKLPDVIKKAMIDIFETKGLINEDCRLVLQIHDELLFEIKNEKISEKEEIITKIMQNAIPLSVPVLVNKKLWNERE